MKKNLPVTQKEKRFPQDYHILSTTDLKGCITYVNREFVNVAEYSPEELLSKNHNIIRHPDMPPAAFADLWNTAKQGDSWMGIVKNRAKSGDHYWVDAYVTPIKHDGEITEYQSVRFTPTAERVARAESVYKSLNNGETPAALKRSAVPYHFKLWAGAALGFSPLIGYALWAGNGIMAGSAALLSLGLSLVMLYLGSSGIRKLASDARAKVDNPLMQHIYTGRGDELGQIELSNQMLRSELRAVVARVRDSSDHLQASADISCTTMSHTTKVADQQQEELSQVAAAVEEMSASVQEVAHNTLTSATAAGDAHQSTQAGIQELEASLTTFHNLAGTVSDATSAIRELDKHSANIESMLDVIRTVAEQTNLLALNAAIEAARAGEAGRGFAVVADEVRTLAQRTSESTDEIEKLISSLQSGVKQSVSTMEISQNLSSASINEVEKIDQLFQRIAQSVQSISDMSHQNASATEEQSAVANEISANINRIHELATESQASTRRAAQVSQESLQQACRQQSLVDQFLRV